MFKLEALLHDERTKHTKTREEFGKSRSNRNNLHGAQRSNERAHDSNNLSPAISQSPPSLEEWERDQTYTSHSPPLTESEPPMGMKKRRKAASRPPQRDEPKGPKKAAWDQFLHRYFGPSASNPR